MSRCEFRIMQGGLNVVGVTANKEDRDWAVKEIYHYAAQYKQDGPLTIEERVGRKWIAIEKVDH